MSEDARDTARRFARRPRDESGLEHALAARAKFEDSLDAIETLLRHAVNGGREAFERDSPAYAAGSLAIIRTAALFEVEAFAAFLSDVPEPVARGILTTRNIASHSGYRAMNDEVLWSTLTTQLPPYLAAWRKISRS